MNIMRDKFHRSVRYINKNQGNINNEKRVEVLSRIIDFLMPFSSHQDKQTIVKQKQRRREEGEAKCREMYEGNCS